MTDINSMSGRFSKGNAEILSDFNSSIRIDSRMYAEDIEGSLAHAKMLAKCGIISENDCEEITKGLVSIKEDIETGALEIDMSAEDIHMFIEAELTKRIGEPGKRLHTARSRNDQVATDIRLYLKKRAAGIIEGLFSFGNTLQNIFQQHTETVMPGYTHLQRAQPITFARHLQAYYHMFQRDIKRLENAVEIMDECPLGSGALAGTTYPIDREYTAELLGFSAPTQNTLDGVSDRDFCVEFACALSIIMTHLSRLSEEIILWSSWEFKFIDLDDAYSTGSSIMPQKKNPDVPELVRGKTGRVNGNLIALLTMLKGLPLAYNKDMQEDKEAIFDSFDTVEECINIFVPMLETMTVNKENMRNAAARGFINATDCADYLTKKGMPFRDAYKITGAIVAYCIENNCILEKLSIEKYKEFSEIFEEDVFKAIDLDECVKRRN
ncbi:MAG: argininosuccinate lyase [Oscillospiraceae bacterium]|jgi:argininosuccinate lyase|nr:argininosuccinate lyase [Oscillospiraceae bacterium]